MKVTHVRVTVFTTDDQGMPQMQTMEFDQASGPLELVMTHQVPKATMWLNSQTGEPLTHGDYTTTFHITRKKKG